MADYRTDNQMKEVHRASVAGIRKALGPLRAIVAEVDRELRYVWIDNPHPDFDAKAVIGKRDDELIPAAEAAQIMSLKREAFEFESPISQTLCFRRSDGLRYYTLSAYPIRAHNGRVDGLLTVGFDVRPPNASR